MAEPDERFGRHSIRHHDAPVRHSTPVNGCAVVVLSAPVSTSRRTFPLRSALRSCAASSSLDTLTALGRARTTTDVSVRHSSRTSSNAARIRRATRCRITALPTDLLTIMPSHGPPELAMSIRQPVGSGHCAGSTDTVSWRSRDDTRTPFLSVREKSDRVEIRWIDAITDPIATEGFRRPALPESRPAVLRRSGRELCAALAATGVDDRTPRAGTHTQPETMHASTTTDVRLESPLALGHGWYSLCSYVSTPNTRAPTILSGLLIKAAVPDSCRLGGPAPPTSPEWAPDQRRDCHHANPHTWMTSRDYWTGRIQIKRADPHQPRDQQ